MTPSGDLSQTQYFDLPAPPAALSSPSSPESSSSDSPHFPIHIDPLTDKEHNNNMKIKAALPEEFSEETRDANRWLMVMKAYFTLHVDKYANEV